MLELSAGPQAMHALLQLCCPAEVSTGSCAGALSRLSAAVAAAVATPCVHLLPLAISCYGVAYCLPGRPFGVYYVSAPDSGVVCCLHVRQWCASSLSISVRQRGCRTVGAVFVGYSRV
jgi:hypothetical protein